MNPAENIYDVRGGVNSDTGSVYGGGGAYAQRPGPATGQRADWVADEVIVKFRQTTPNEEIDRLCRKHGGKVLYTRPYAGFDRIKLPAGLSPEQAVGRFKNEPAVEYAELSVDQNGDGIVDRQDFALLCANWSGA